MDTVNAIKIPASLDVGIFHAKYHRRIKTASGNLYYQANAQGKDNEIINYHPLYHSLGKTKAQRLDAYKSLLKAHIDEKQPGFIRTSWQTGTAYDLNENK